MFNRFRLHEQYTSRPPLHYYVIHNKLHTISLDFFKAFLCYLKTLDNRVYFPNFVFYSTNYFSAEKKFIRSEFQRELVWKKKLLFD